MRLDGTDAPRRSGHHVGLRRGLENLAVVLVLHEPTGDFRLAVGVLHLPHLPHLILVLLLLGESAVLLGVVDVGLLLAESELLRLLLLSRTLAGEVHARLNTRHPCAHVSPHPKIHTSISVAVVVLLLRTYIEAHFPAAVLASVRIVGTPPLTPVAVVSVA